MLTYLKELYFTYIHLLGSLGFLFCFALLLFFLMGNEGQIQPRGPHHCSKSVWVRRSISNVGRGLTIWKTLQSLWHLNFSESIIYLGCPGIQMSSLATNWEGHLNELSNNNNPHRLLSTCYVPGPVLLGPFGMDHLIRPRRQILVLAPFYR